MIPERPEAGPIVTLSIMAALEKGDLSEAGRLLDAAPVFHWLICTRCGERVWTSKPPGSCLACVGDLRPG